jgi:hypothetical protein
VSWIFAIAEELAGKVAARARSGGTVSELARLLARAGDDVLKVARGTAVLAQTGKPFEQLDIDRAFPNIPEHAASATVYPLGGSAPYEQLLVDRALPEVVADEPTRLAAAAGETRSDAEIAVDEETAVEEQATVSPFANDWNFIAPAP